MKVNNNNNNNNNPFIFWCLLEPVLEIWQVLLVIFSKPGFHPKKKPCHVLKSYLERVFFWYEIV